jgi:hypothetical protein
VTVVTAIGEFAARSLHPGGVSALMAEGSTRFLVSGIRRRCEGHWGRAPVASMSQVSDPTHLTSVPSWTWRLASETKSPRMRRMRPEEPVTDDSLNRIIEKVVHETVPRTIQLRVTVAQRQFDARGGETSLTLERTYYETAGGERFFDERMTEAGKLPNRLTFYCDGTKCANVRYMPDDPERQQMVAISHDFMIESKTGYRDGPEPFRYDHVALTPLHEALPAAEPIGHDRVVSRSCNLFHFKEVGLPGHKQSLVYSLDEETSVPLKVAAYRNPEQIRENVPNWVWEATTLDTISGRHYPRKSKYSSFRVSKGDDGHWVSKPHLSKTIDTSEITFDADIPKTAFWPAIQPGVLVFDGVAKKHYQTPGGTPAKQAASTAVPPIRLAPESRSWFPGIGVALSLAAGGVAALLWYRSR